MSKGFVLFMLSLGKGKRPAAVLIRIGAGVKNKYFLMRHGKSEANQAGLICSDPDIGVKNYGLLQESFGEIEKALQDSPLNSETLICSSDFLRTRQTAEYIRQLINSEAVYYTPLLRERFFGNFDLKEDVNYTKVWQQDLLSKDHKWMNVESLQSVRDRGEELIRELEDKYSGKSILLVSHGDVLQILQTFFEGISPRAHRGLDYLNTGEIREAILKRIDNK